MRNFAILTVGFALAMLGPGGPSVAWAGHTVTYDQDSGASPKDCTTDTTIDSVDIDRLTVNSIGTPTDIVIVTMELCAAPTDRAKYMVYFDFDDRDYSGVPQPVLESGSGIGGVGDFDACPEENRTFDASGKVRLSVHKKRET